MEYIINGQRGGATINIQHYSCWPVGSCNPPAPPPATPEDEFRYWSDASNWPGGKLPAEGDIVEI